MSQGADIQSIQANLEALRMLGVNGTENGDKGVENGATPKRGPYARAREYARDHDYWGWFKETRAKKNYPSYYTWYHSSDFWMEFVNFTPEEKVAFATKFENAKVKNRRIFEYYVGTHFWLEFLEWDTEQQTAYAAADRTAGEDYEFLRRRWAALGEKERWTTFVNMTPEAKKIRAENVQKIIDREEEKRRMDYFWDYGSYGEGGNGYDNRVETWYDRNGNVTEEIHHGKR